MKAIIAAGGKGTRLYPLTFTSNKHLIPIANRPLLSYPLENIAEVGIKDVGIIVNPDTQDAIKDYVGKGEKWGIKVSYIEQLEPLGLAHVVEVSQKFLGDSPFVYHLGDNIFSKGIKGPFKVFAKKKPDALLTVLEHDENYRLGVPFFDKQGNLKEVVEKPKNPPNRYGVPGLYMFSSKVFEAYKGRGRIKPSARGELEITDLYNWMLSHDKKVEVAELDGKWRDPGKFDDSLEANKLMLEIKVKKDVKGKVDKDSNVSGEVEIGKGSRIVNSKIVGPVSIGENVHIRNSFVGPFTSIASECEIVNASIEYCILMEDIDIADVKGKIEASMIGKHTRIITPKTKARAPIYSFTVADHCTIELPF